MEALTLVLAIAALLAGLTGTWSPCGFSMIETIGPTGHTGGRRTTLAACATFLPGALVGAIATFGLLGAAGELLHGASGRAAYLVAAAIALGAAALEARGTPILPQVRRQLPEHWRRVLPMPLAAALYGVLLGLGFTTFVLSYGVWALMGVSFAVGDAEAGLFAGLAFGIGRALPIVSLAPLAGSRAGTRVIETMAARPGLLRGIRAGDAVVLTALAIVLAGALPAGAMRIESRHAADPSAYDTDLAFQRADRGGVLRRGGDTTPLPGKDPSIGGPFIAVRNGESVTVLKRRTLEPIRDVHAAGANAIAVSGNWLVWRNERQKPDKILARSIRHIDDNNPRPPGRTFTLANAKDRELSAPAIYGDQVVYAAAGKHENAIIRRSLPGGGGGSMLSSRFFALMAPSFHEGVVLFVRVGQDRQQLVLKRRGSHSTHTLYSRDADNGILYSTSLRQKRAYATLIRGDHNSRIISVSR